MLRNDARTTRRGFTLVEMLVVVTILGLLSGMVLVALAGAAETAREARTRSQIQKLNEFLMNRYESYRTRRTPRPATGNAIIQARARVDQIRAVMLQEMPDRKTDLFVDHRGLTSGKYSATYARHQRAVEAFTNNEGNWTAAYAAWTAENQHAECLYLILASINDGETSALEFLHDSEVGDTDGDGVPEVLDGWGNPIAFIRWPQGYVNPDKSEQGFGLQDITVYDAFDPLRVRGRSAGTVGAPDVYEMSNSTPVATGFAHFNLVPLVVSAGKDGIFDIVGDTSTGTTDTTHGITYANGSSAVDYLSTTPKANPYAFATTIAGDNLSVGVGAITDVNGDGYDNSLDNISNHYLIVGGNSP
ncbi:type II secretion system protein [Blastopirellula retiformator]|uniref:Type II secretion system protein G n=1 Tax=Blastopirellula retiformator TaxID=2527970 RepID=A0A5C5UWX3_9BACT|nr:prepilin-type N-terminal cleavage/methylation domain-containing protein [Blastopirellula retiformator]TWT30057.1 hypothetical protein Enr8_47140 [Blastopirellula retiformator]